MGGFLGEQFGFRESFWITGALLGLAGIAVVIWVREDFVPKPQAQRPSFFAAYGKLIRAPGMKGLYSLTFLRSMGATLITPIIALFILNLNANVEQGAATITGLTLGAAALTSAISAVYLGRLGDRIGHNKVLIASAVAAMLLHIPQIFVQAPWQMILLQGLAGIALGGLVPSTAALMNFWAPGGSQGATYGLDNSVQAGARVFAPMLSALIAATVGFRGVFAATAFIYLVIAVVAMQVVRSARQRHAVTVGLELTTAE
jgi:DHA1 family multidrug resistance protein-like MFS transporter